MQNSLVSSSTFLHLVSPSKQYQYDNNKSENKKKKERIVKGRKVGRVSDRKTGPQLNSSSGSATGYSPPSGLVASLSRSYLVGFRYPFILVGGDRHRVINVFCPRTLWTGSFDYYRTKLQGKPVSFLPIYYLGRTYPSFQKNAHCQYLASQVSSSLVKTLSPPFQHPAAVAETIWLSLTPYIIQRLLFEVVMCPSRQPPLQLDNKPRVYLVKSREPEAEMIALCSQVERVDFLKRT